jgi:hypothetical protein
MGAWYAHKRDFKIIKSKIIAKISLTVTFSNGHSFGPSMTHEVSFTAIE